MKRLAILTIAAAALWAAGRGDTDNWKFEDRDTVQRTFDVAGGTGAPKLLVDNVFGYIHVTAAAGRQVRVTVQKHTIGRSAEAIAESKREVKLDISQQGNFVRLYEDGPFRSASGGTSYRCEEYYGYRVTYDFDVEAPPEIELTLKSMNGGTIAVKGTTGDYQIHGFNGGIDMEDIAGSGSIRTFNGKLKVAYAKNPARASDFKTFNGTMDVWFQAPLNADLTMKSFNGGVWADFDVTPLPAQTSAQGGRIIYSSRNRTHEVRAGAGGPKLTFEGFNGAIKLHTKGQ
jgi:hypothetical protein